MAVYVSFSDESGSGNKTGKFLIGGYVANEIDWPEFSLRWSEEILSPRPTIPYLHMVEMRSDRWRQKHSITRTQADEKVRRAVELISGTNNIEPYLSSLSEVCYKNCKARLDAARVKAKAHHNEIDYVCFIAYALSCMKLVKEEKPDAHLIKFNIAEKQFISHYIEKGLQQDLQVGLPPESQKMFGGITSLAMADYMPLQAADVLCWHLQRTNLGRQNEEREVRENTEILQRKEIAGSEIPDSAMEKITENLIHAIRTGKYGLEN